MKSSMPAAFLVAAPERLGPTVAFQPRPPQFGRAPHDYVIRQERAAATPAPRAAAELRQELPRGRRRGDVHAQAGGLRILNPAAILAAPGSLASTSRRTVRPARRTYWWASGLPRAGLTALPTWDQDQSRSRHLIAVADGAGPVAESSETNHPRSKFITINTP